MSDQNRPVQCCRCKNKHMESDRVPKPDAKCSFLSNMVCPRCGANAYYDLHPMIAWCFASGEIELGESCPDGAIKFAHGPKSFLKSVISAVARHGYGANAGKLLVPGIPEAESQRAAGNALKAFVDWAAKGRYAKKYGVVFSFQEEC